MALALAWVWPSDARDSSRRSQVAWCRGRVYLPGQCAYPCGASVYLSVKWIVMVGVKTSQSSSHLRCGACSMFAVTCPCDSGSLSQALRSSALVAPLRGSLFHGHNQLLLLLSFPYVRVADVPQRASRRWHAVTMPAFQITRSWGVKLCLLRLCLEFN